MKRQSYLPPCAEIIQIESQTVLCASGGGASLGGNSTEGVTTTGFNW